MASLNCSELDPEIFNRWGPYFTADDTLSSLLTTSQPTSLSTLPLHRNNQTAEGTAALKGGAGVGGMGSDPSDSPSESAFAIE